MLRPMPVEPRFSRRLSILNSMPSDFSSSLRRLISSFRMSSLVVPSSSSLIASSVKNSRSSIASPFVVETRGTASARHEATEVIRARQVVSNLDVARTSRARLASDHALPVPRRPRHSSHTSRPWRGCRSRRSGGSAAASARTSWSPSSCRPKGFAARTRRRSSKLRFGPDERPIGVQIFGADPEAMGDAARLVTDVFQPEFIDINFGCPVKKVVQAERRLGLPQGSRPRAGGHPRRVARRRHLPVTVQDPQRLERGDARSGGDRAALPGRRRARAHAASAHAHADVHRAARAGTRSRRSSTRSRFR